jgi:hypothetical protein
MSDLEQPAVVDVPAAEDGQEPVEVETAEA